MKRTKRKLERKEGDGCTDVCVFECLRGGIGLGGGYKDETGSEVFKWLLNVEPSKEKCRKYQSKKTKQKQTAATFHFVIFHQRFRGILLKRQKGDRGDGLTPLGMVTGWAGLFSVAISLLNLPSELLFL